MEEETKNINGTLESLADFDIETEEQTVNIDDEEIVLADDLEGFAKGFPDWDLLPPKK